MLSVYNVKKFICEAGDVDVYLLSIQKTLNSIPNIT